MPEPAYYISQGDVGVVLSDTLKDSAGVAVNIQNATVQFHLAPISSSTGTSAINTTASNDQVGDGTDGTAGQVSYDFVAGNTAVAGYYAGEWGVTFAGGEIQTYPNDDKILVYIRPQVA